jgi:hypothetical protein
VTSNFRANFLSFLRFTKISSFLKSFWDDFVRFLFFAFVFYLNFVLIDAKLFFVCDK